MAKKSVELIYREGKPVAVIISLEEYRELLARLEDAEDLKTLKKLRQRKLHFKKLDKFLEQYSPSL